MQLHRPFLLAAIGGAIVSLGACTTAPESRDGVLDARLAGPCNRLVLSWLETASRLRALMGGGFEPSISDGVGAMRLSVLRCGLVGVREPQLTFAHLSVPISADSVPLVITRMPDDGWAWLPFVIVDTESSGVFAAMGYDTEVAAIEFEVDSTTDTPSIAMQLSFDTGRISVTAKTMGKEIVYTGNQALVSTDHQYHSVFFGKETADRSELVSVDVDLQGDTPLAKGDLERQPERAVLDSGLRLDHVYWRLPRSQPSLEPVRSEEP